MAKFEFTQKIIRRYEIFILDMKEIHKFSLQVALA